MRFHGMMLLRDEEDIIAQNLDHLLTWIDALYVFDLGSTDRTWDIVQDYARRDSRIVPYLHRPTVYSDGLRCVLFDRYRDRFAPGDWIMKIDSDEFYHIAPPQFVRERVRPGETAVHLMWYFFRLTAPEVAAYESGAVDEAADRARPIAERRRFYQIPRYAEPRMFRYRRAMQWPSHVSMPFNVGFVSREQIPIRHYPHRDPTQMVRRYHLRSLTMKIHPTATGDHWKLDDWRKDVFDPDAANSSRREGVAHLDGLSDALREWAPGTELPDPRPRGHLPGPGTRLVQRLVHPLLLPLLDRRRPRYDKSFQPAAMPPVSAG